MKYKYLASDNNEYYIDIEPNFNAIDIYLNKYRVKFQNHIKIGKIKGYDFWAPEYIRDNIYLLKELKIVAIKYLKLEVFD